MIFFVFPAFITKGQDLVALLFEGSLNLSKYSLESSRPSKLLCHLLSIKKKAGTQELRSGIVTQ